MSGATGNTAISWPIVTASPAFIDKTNIRTFPSHLNGRWTFASGLPSKDSLFSILARQVVEDHRRGGPLVPNRTGGLISDKIDQAASDERGTERNFSPHLYLYHYTLGLSIPKSLFSVSSLLKQIVVLVLAFSRYFHYVTRYRNVAIQISVNK
jgi:hypothetical protein